MQTKETRRILAKDLRPGMTMAFLNSRLDYVIEGVSDTRSGEVRVVHGNDTGIDYFLSDEFVLVRD